LAVKVGIVNELLSTLIKKKESKTKFKTTFNTFGDYFPLKSKFFKKKILASNNSETRIYNKILEYQLSA